MIKITKETKCNFLILESSKGNRMALMPWGVAEVECTKKDGSHINGMELFIIFEELFGREIDWWGPTWGGEIFTEQVVEYYKYNMTEEDFNHFKKHGFEQAIKNIVGKLWQLWADIINAPIRKKINNPPINSYEVEIEPNYNFVDEYEILGDTTKFKQNEEIYEIYYYYGRGENLCDEVIKTFDEIFGYE